MVFSRHLVKLNAAVALIALSPLHAAEVSYSREIRPILQRQCQGCHQPNVKSSGLDVTTYEGVQAGGKRGGALKAGAPDESPLVQYLTGAMKPQMPMGQPALKPEEIELFRSWIAAGAKDDTPADARDTLSLDKPVTYAQPPVTTALAFSPDGGMIAVSGYREILLIPSDGTTPSKRLPGMSERVHSLAFSPDGISDGCEDGHEASVLLCSGVD